MSIKIFVIRQLDAGKSIEAAWAAARQRFPHKICGRGYIMRIHKEWLTRAALQEQGAYKP